MFRATMCPSSGEITVPMRHLVLVTLYRWLSRMHTSHLYRVTNTRSRIGTVFSPDDGHIVSRNMYRKAINLLKNIVHQVGSIYKTEWRHTPQDIYFFISCSFSFYLKICTPLPIMFRWSNREEWGGRGKEACIGESRGVYRVLVGKPEGKRPLGGPRRKWEDNIKMDLQEVGCGDMDWIDMFQDRDRLRALVNA